MTIRFRSERNQAHWEKTVAREAAWLIGYLLAGDPDRPQSLELITRSLAAGLDVLELGVPSPRPHLDGDIIQRGHMRARRQLSQQEELLHYWQEVRTRVDRPIWAMGYQAELVLTGLYRQLADRELIDAVIIPDCNPAELAELDHDLEDTQVDVVRLVNSAMTDDELARICASASLIYAQSYPGKTGATIEGTTHVGQQLYARIRQHTSAFVMLGFGLRTPEMVGAAVENGYQGAVVGSVLVEQVEAKQEQKLYELIAQMKQHTCRDHFKNK